MRWWDKNHRRKVVNAKYRACEAYLIGEVSGRLPEEAGCSWARQPHHAGLSSPRKPIVGDIEELEAHRHRHRRAPVNRVEMEVGAAVTCRESAGRSLPAILPTIENLLL
ncbi:hypothetical protein HPP92_018361 [Vanilla planifolia]|uniref:Uncharacterized protein n=1 Tax=Vanilla planifolia TaxID=51239 RepID=A0A835QCT9_VANPL|nr:hypothetical protein HPP92_018972 [Vanilla planifolia]KAG0469033.1 hypothetical protein HPP92_018361 [Vanilla planifolia]